jgi:GTP-binding protein
MTGVSGADLYIDVPEGTVVADMDTGETLGDLTESKQALMVARGGRGGRGNTRFKSSVNRAPRRSTPGEPGESRRLALSLKLLADVGLLGAPNAGKSTLTRTLSAARPKVAAYPFTTLNPQLGVVRVGDDASFVIADIPGLIEGAHSGAGLGTQFLRHLERNRLLLHLVDAGGQPESADPVEAIRMVSAELGRYSERLASLPRWLVINKIDLIPREKREALLADIVARYDWRGPVFAVSAATGEGTAELCGAIARHLGSEED